MKTALIRWMTVFLAAATIHARAAQPPAKTDGKSTSNAGSATATLQLKKFRFQSHEPEVFERLVLEFMRKSKAGKAPSIKVAPDPKTKDTAIEVGDCQWVGAIPEASINDAYGPKSRYLGKLAVNTDNPKALTLKISMKTDDATVDAFWLESPPRLVLDVFPKSSPRAAGPQVLKSASRSVARVASQSAPKVARNGFTCFPANSELNGAVKEEGEKANEEEMQIRIDTAIMQSAEAEKGAIHCYPRKAELHAKIIYDPPKVEKTAMKKETAPPAAPPTKSAAEAPALTTLTPKPLLGNTAAERRTEMKAEEKKIPLLLDKTAPVEKKEATVEKESATAAKISTTKLLDEEDAKSEGDINIVTGTNGNPKVVKEKSNEGEREVSAAKHLDAGPLLDVKVDGKKPEGPANPGSLLPPLK